MPAKCSFRVIHVSGQEENHKAVELNTHSPTTKGWQSSRFCLYPQDIVVQLDNRSRLRKLQILSHQHLIATKIEFYVGDVPDGTPTSLQNARYTRLGYVALSDNAKTGFKARELKSVHVDAMGVFVKFVIHKNHINKHNLYNQVGIVALNVIGDVTTPDSYPYVAEDKIADPALAGLFNRPDYISPLDDLAFDMYQDPEVGQIIRKLEAKKQEAVLQERYDYAKKLKSAIQDLQKVGEKLGKYEVEKRQAVENEDYDKAKLKKVQMEEYRIQVYKQLEIHDLLEMSGSRHPQPVDLEPIRQPTPPRLKELPLDPTPKPGSPPLPAIKNYERPPQEPELPGDDSPTPYDDRPVPAAVNAPKQQEPEPEEEIPQIKDESSGNLTGEPEAMNEKDQRDGSVLIDAFGTPIASKAYSKTWSFREDALLEVYKQMSELPTDTPKDESKQMMRAAVFLVNKSIKDKVFAVYTASLQLLKLILTEFVPNHKLSKQDTSYAVEKTTPTLLQKTGDTAARNRDAAKNYILEEAQFDEVKPLHAVPHECVKPFKLTIAPRLALSRTEVVESLYEKLGLQNSGNGLTIENMMRFCTQALEHTAGEVREKAEKIIIKMYKDMKESPDEKDRIKEHLPPDDEKTRKSVLYKQMFVAFDRIDGKPSKDDLKKQKQDEEAAKQQEIKALQNQLQNLKDMAAGKAPIDDNLIKDGDPPPSKAKDKKKPKPKSKPPLPSEAENDDNKSIFPIDHTCIFCGEKNEQFSEEGLDLHYWKSCPMLKRCSYCKQVVEIAGLTDHLLTECDNKDNFQKCTRCSEAVLKTEYDQHMTDKSDQHPAFETGKNHCPLCHQNYKSGEDGWKQHLMSKEGCKQNARRLQALSKQGKPGAKAGGKGLAKAPSKVAGPGKKR